jgi:hypothetical protein
MPPYRRIHPRGKSRKLSLLTDLEFRVWIQYLLCADDFGIMPRSTLVLRSADKHLESRKPRELERCLTRLEEIGLVDRFEHQGDVYLFQPTWQDYQCITWPTKTLHPALPDERLVACSESTRLLMSVHPGAKKVPVPIKEERRAADRTPEYVQSADVGTSSTRETLTLHAPPVLSSIEEKVIDVEGFPIDRWLRELQAAYPPQRVTRGHMTEVAFTDALLKFSGGVMAGWLLMQTTLALNVSSHEWRVKGMVPKLEKYLREGLWQNALPADAPAGEQLTAKTNRTLQGAADALRSVS